MKHGLIFLALASVVTVGCTSNPQTNKELQCAGGVLGGAAVGGLIGNGTALAHTGTTPSSITLTDPAADQGALTEYDASSGTNLAVVTFDATLDATVAMTQVLTNQAQVTNFSGSESGPNFVLQPIEDTATVTTAPPTFTIVALAARLADHLRTVVAA